jgi:hypothetical protein
MKFSVGPIVVVALVVWSTQAPAIAPAATSPPSTVSPLLKLRRLVNLCERKDATSRAACGSYISGFVAGSETTRTADAVKVVADRVFNGAVAPSDEAIDAAVSKLDNELRVFCILSEWTAGYVGAVVVQYGREHPDQLNDNTSDHMLKILAKAFPCIKQPPNSP